MIPKNKRRLIVVDDVQYEYCVTGFHTTKIFIKNFATNKTLDYYFDYAVRVTPSFVEQLIRR